MKNILLKSLYESPQALLAFTTVRRFGRAMTADTGNNHLSHVCVCIYKQRTLLSSNHYYNKWPLQRSNVLASLYQKCIFTMNFNDTKGYIAAASTKIRTFYERVDA